MYRPETYRRVITRIQELRKLQQQNHDLIGRIELGIRIDNLKELLVFTQKNT